MKTKESAYLKKPETLSQIQRRHDAVCTDLSRDKAMISVHAEAGTRINEILAMKIKDFTLDKFGGMIKVNGKTGVRPIRIVKSVPYITKWLNDHPYKDNFENPLWVYIRNSDSFGKPMTYIMDLTQY